MSSNVIDTNVVTSSSASSALSRFYRLKVLAVKPETRDAVVITFEAPPAHAAEFGFIQGQYVTLRTILAGEELRRSYSICSATQDRQLRVAVKRASGGIFSNWIFENLKPGDFIEVMPPAGRFHVPLSPTNCKHYVAFAVGSGITPIYSIVKTTLAVEPNSRFTLFYGNRASSTIMFREELAELKDVFLARFNLVHLMSREHQDAELLNGRIDGSKAMELVRKFCLVDKVDTAFLCGPQEMVQEVAGALGTLGLSQLQIKIELFTAGENSSRAGRLAATPAQAPECAVTLVADGTRRHFAMARDKTVLDGALQQGIDLRYSCKSGVCATCRAKLIDGQVDMDANYALEDYEIARGFILTCQSFPVTERITVDFDQDN